MDAGRLQRVIRARVFRTPYNLQQARTGAFILVVSIVCLAVSIANGDPKYSLVGAVGVIGGSILLWMSYRVWSRKRRRRSRTT